MRRVVRLVGLVLFASLPILITFHWYRGKPRSDPAFETPQKKVASKSGSANARTGSDPAFWTALVEASKNQDEAEIERLLTQRAKLPTIHDQDRTALTLAVGMPANFDTWGDTPLAGPALASRTQLVSLLLDDGADPNVYGIRHFSKSPILVQAASYGYGKMVRLLLDKGAFINALGEGGETALMAAVAMDRRDVVRLLLQRGAAVNVRDKEGNTALMKAASTGYPDAGTVSLLLAHGADARLRNEAGATALELALHGTHLDKPQLPQVLRLLKRAKVDATATP